MHVVVFAIVLTRFGQLGPIAKFPRCVTLHDCVYSSSDNVYER